jgi:succinate dehydrogenase / fumarate reductase membrane anchor subunit
MSRTATGLRAWVVQRATAIYLGLFFVYLILHWLGAPPADYAAWRAWVGHPAMGTALLLFVVALLLHAWVGMRDILIDYVQPTALRVGLLALVGLGLVACALWATVVLLLARL